MIKIQYLFQLRGTSGSGKTFVAYKLLKRFNFRPVRNSKKKIIGYYCKEHNFFMVGRYETACGGADTIKTQDELCRIIKKALKKGYNVFFEGIVCSHLAERYAKVYFNAVEQGVKVQYIFLNTPLEKCKENINKRRAKAGKPPSEPRQVKSNYTSTYKSRENLISYGIKKEELPILSGKEAYKLIVRCLEKGKEENE